MALVKHKTRKRQRHYDKKESCREKCLVIALVTEHVSVDLVGLIRIFIVIITRASSGYCTAQNVVPDRHYPRTQFGRVRSSCVCVILYLMCDRILVA